MVPEEYAGEGLQQPMIRGQEGRGCVFSSLQSYGTDKRSFLRYTYGGAAAYVFGMYN